jgi:hypothetical protein
MSKLSFQQIAEVHLHNRPHWHDALAVKKYEALGGNYRNASLCYFIDWFVWCVTWFVLKPVYKHIEWAERDYRSIQEGKRRKRKKRQDPFRLTWLESLRLHFHYKPKSILHGKFWFEWLLFCFCTKVVYNQIDWSLERFQNLLKAKGIRK